MKSLIVLLTTLISLSAFSAQSFKLDPSLGKVEFKTKGWPNLINIKGEGTGVSGLVKLDQGKVSGALVFDLTTLKTGIALRDDHMKNKYLEVKTYPQATLTLDSLEVPKDLDGDFDLSAKLKLHGLEKSIKGKAELESKDGNLMLNAKFQVVLSDFKIEIPSYKGITVADKVNVSFESKVNSLTQLSKN